MAISEVTNLMTRQGWIAAKDLSDGEDIYGIDRHGQPKLRQVSIRARKTASLCGIIGTEASVGCFAADTALLTRDGSVRVVSEIIKNGSLRGLWFENMVDLHDSDAFAQATNLKGMLIKIASFVGARKMAFRCRS